MTAPTRPSRRAARPRRTRQLIGLACVLGLSLALLPAASHAVEEPAYTIVRSYPAFEIRQYAAYTVAEVMMPPPADDVGNRAFPILAGYIFGKNKGERKLAMTAPVTQAPVPAKLDMTAPVTQSTGPDGILVQFVLPRDINIDNAPLPLDPRIRLREVPPTQVAVIRYSGFWSQANYDQHLAELKAALRAADIRWTGEPVLSRYNSPMTPWFMRRNEIWLKLD